MRLTSGTRATQLARRDTGHRVPSWQAEAHADDNRAQQALRRRAAPGETLTIYVGTCATCDLAVRYAVVRGLVTVAATRCAVPQPARVPLTINPSRASGEKVSTS